MEDKVLDLAIAGFVFILWRWDSVRYERRLRNLQKKHDSLMGVLVRIQYNIKNKLLLVVEENTRSLKKFSDLAYRLAVSEENRDRKIAAAVLKVEELAVRLEKKIDSVFNSEIKT